MIYFDNASTSFPKAPKVGENVKEFIEKGCFNINRGSYKGGWEVSEIVFETREILKNFFSFNGSSKNIVFTSGVTSSLNMTLTGLLKKGDHVITTSMEHNGVLRPLYQLSKIGVEVDIIHCNSNGELDINLLKEKIKSNTKAVVTVHGSNVNGVIMPIEEIGKICREKSIYFILDAAQTAGVIDINIEKSHIDALCFPGHKGLLALQGIGGLILSEDLAKELKPIKTGGTGSFSHKLNMPNTMPDKFEAGTLNLPGIVALNTSLKYIQKLSAKKIYEEELKLLKYFEEEAEKIPGVKIIGNKGNSKRCPVSVIDFDKIDTGEMAYKLDERYGIMTRSGLHCAPYAHKTLGTYPKGLLRISFGYENTLNEIDILLNAIKEILKN